MECMSRCLVPVEHSVNAASVFSSVRWGLDLRIPEGPSQFRNLRPHAGQGSGSWSLSLCFQGVGSLVDPQICSPTQSPCPASSTSRQTPGVPESGTDSQTLPHPPCVLRGGACLQAPGRPHVMLQMHVWVVSTWGLVRVKLVRIGVNSLHEQVFLLLLGKSPNPHRRLPPDTSLVTPLASHTLRGGPSSVQYCLKCCLYWVLGSLLEANWFTTSATHTPNPSLTVPSHSRATVLLPYLPQSQLPNNEG